MDTSKLAVPGEARVCRSKRQIDNILNKMGSFADDKWSDSKTFMKTITWNIVNRIILALHPSIKVDFSCHNHFYVDFNSLFLLVERFLNLFLLTFGIVVGILILILCIGFGCCMITCRLKRMTISQYKKNRRY